LSLSPEALLKLREIVRKANPLNVRLPRYDTEEDVTKAAGPQCSLIDRAENATIADLPRNDFSKECDRVEATELF
jgi:anthranilate/para-aminobenzoate synthase component I